MCFSTTTSESPLIIIHNHVIIHGVNTLISLNRCVTIFKAHARMSLAGVIWAVGGFSSVYSITKFTYKCNTLIKFWIHLSQILCFEGVLFIVREICV